jgi:geranylgeranylglycerol-phosphate geranylgeranyltransferase
LNCLISFVSVIVAGIICLHGKFPEQIIFLAALSAALTAASGNIINDIFDIEIDKINRPDRPIPSNKIVIKEAYIYYFVLVVVSIGISVLVSVPAFLIVSFSHFLLFIYSKLLKQIPLAGNILISFLTGLVFIFGGVVVENPIAAAIPAVFAFLINFIREIVKDMQDIEGDKKVDIKTFPIQFGFKFSKTLILITTLVLILFTFFPFVTKLYKIDFFILVMVVVNPILIYCLKLLFEDNYLKKLSKISNLLKLDMVIGLIAIYLGV